MSTRSQEQLASLAAQISSLTRLVATSWFWTIADIYIEIRSGSKASERIEFQRMLNDCHAGKVDIIMKSISRFGRNTVDTLQVLNEFRSHCIEVIFEADGQCTSDPESGLVISILEAHAQQEMKNAGRTSCGG